MSKNDQVLQLKIPRGESDWPILAFSSNHICSGSKSHITNKATNGGGRYWVAGVCVGYGSSKASSLDKAGKEDKYLL